MFILLFQSTFIYSQNGINLEKLNKSEYFLKGYDFARKEYKGYGAIALGFPSGIFPFIGPFLGASIFSFTPVKVPHKYVSNIELENKFEFELGYKNYVSNSRYKKFFVSGIVGSLVTIGFFMYTFRGVADHG